mmetsp:Transcript_4040/g.14413  ORF Transcript_4040/g.14413 Transcript_4040/m.14413 type:complete len:175 (-) Transcript_4040:2461-2985(-)
MRLKGDDIKQRHWDAFYRFYLDTVERKWGQNYLTREFFDMLGQRMRDDVMLVMAEEEGGRLIAGALNLIGEDTIYGRNWGCIKDVKFLHFEVCYYQAIEEAINSKVARVEAGAQGQHKIQRGYLPTKTYSNHYITNKSFEVAIKDFLKTENEEIADTIAYLEECSPFKTVGDGP